MGIEIYLLYIGWRVESIGEMDGSGSGDGWCHLTVFNSFFWGLVSMELGHKNEMKGSRTRMGI
jgi:hypothetical protein